MKRALLLVGMMLALVVGAVSAHGLEPVKSSPEAGSKLVDPPAEVRVWFEEEVAVEGSSLRVLDSGGQPVDLGGGGVDLDDPQRAQLAVKLPKLGQGAYQVEWQVKLLDGDSSSGSFWFGVGDVTVPTAEPEGAPAETTAPAGGISPVVWAILAIGVVLVGIAAGIWFGARRKQA